MITKDVRRSVDYGDNLIEPGQTSAGTSVLPAFRSVGLLDVLSTNFSRF
jgi:hypothetical protein